MEELKKTPGEIHAMMTILDVVHEECSSKSKEIISLLEYKKDSLKDCYDPIKEDFNKYMDEFIQKLSGQRS